MTGFGTGQITVNRVQPIRRQFDQGVEINEVIESGIAVGDDIGGYSQFYGHLGGSFDDAVQPAAISATGQNPDFFHLLCLLLNIENYVIISLYENQRIIWNYMEFCLYSHY